LILKLLSYNIHFGGKGHEAELIKVINSVAPDLVIFQEAILPGVIEAVARGCSLPYWASRASYSIGFASRLEISDYEWLHPTGSRHAYLDLGLKGSELRIFGLHLSAWFSSWRERRRNREIRSLLESIGRHNDRFHILAGDFNTLAPGEILESKRMPPWIRALIWASGRDIQRETITTMLQSGYIDGYRYLNPDAKGYTFPTWDPHVRLDYIFLPAQFKHRLVKCSVLYDAESVKLASDHYPVLAEIDIG
jgi:endonuclease/exonuclease/phosphatase family metal-dependent hydrolase